MSSSAPAASVCRPPSSATMTTTVQTARTRLPVPNPLAALAPSGATTRCAFRSSGAATATATAPMAPTSGRRTAMDTGTSRACVATATSSSVPMGSASTAAGGATETRTARITRTKPTAVSYLSFCFIPFSPLFFFLFLQISFLCLIYPEFVLIGTETWFLRLRRSTVSVEACLSLSLVLALGGEINAEPLTGSKFTKSPSIPMLSYSSALP